MKIDWIESAILAASGIPIGRKDIQSLHEQGIRAIVTLTEQPLDVQKEISSELLTGLNISCLHLPIVDQNPPEEAQVHELVGFVTQMQNEGKPVFVHCHAGVGRTGTMLHAYYLMNGLTLEEAKLKVKSGRMASQFLMLTDSQKAFLENLEAVRRQEP
jgi:atypical dual specificity phosphatase